PSPWGSPFYRDRTPRQGGAAPSSLRLQRRPSGRRGCACTETGLPRGRPHTRLALGMFPAPSFRPCP
ncbi:hypothetical protein P7K49_035351, partial [Saguinus oedipus]